MEQSLDENTQAGVSTKDGFGNVFSSLYLTFLTLCWDPLCWEPRSKKGPDQKVLKKHVWPWARFNAMQHDSYRCGMYPGSIGFPTRRKKELGNYIASNNSTMWFRCPKQCRRQPEWTHC